MGCQLRLASRIQITHFIDISQYIEAVYRSEKAHDETFTHKRFGALLGLGATHVTVEYIKGRRPVSRKAAEKMVKALSLEGKQKRYFFLLAQYQSEKSPSKKIEIFDLIYQLKQENLQGIDQAQHDFFSNWHNSVILEYITMRENKLDLNSLSKKTGLGFTKDQIRKSIDILRRLDLIKIDSFSNKFVTTGKDMSTGFRVKSEQIKKYHLSLIDRSKEALESIEGERRDFSSYTFAGNENTLNRVKSLIRQFQAMMIQETSVSEEKNNIYQVNIQLFPFLKEGVKNDQD